MHGLNIISNTSMIHPICFSTFVIFNPFLCLWHDLSRLVEICSIVNLLNITVVCIEYLAILSIATSAATIANLLSKDWIVLRFFDQKDDEVMKWKNNNRKCLTTTQTGIFIVMWNYVQHILAFLLNDQNRSVIITWIQTNLAAIPT